VLQFVKCKAVVNECLVFCKDAEGIKAAPHMHRMNASISVRIQTGAELLQISTSSQVQRTYRHSVNIQIGCCRWSSAKPSSGSASSFARMQKGTKPSPASTMTQTESCRKSSSSVPSARKGNQERSVSSFVWVNRTQPHRLIHIVTFSHRGQLFFLDQMSNQSV